MRNTGTLEEAELTEDTNGQEPQPETSAPASTVQPEAPEPDVIEGEVIVIEPPEPSEDHIPPKQKPYWLLVPFTILACLLFLAGSYLLPLLAPSATITIIPIERSITTTAAITVQARAIAPLTLSQSATVPAMGKRQQSATRAAGTITFYNGLLTPQTIAGGTILTGSDGTQVVTDQAATIPAANPPMEGQITIPAHALLVGGEGNIPAYDINTACCASSVVAKNTNAFTGGASARDVVEVSSEDINNAVTTLLVTLSRSENAALTAQLHPGEALLTPPCKPVVSSTHKPGDEATQLTVTVSETCSGIAYISHEVYANATQMITKDAAKRVGTGYSPIGDIQATILQATATTNRQGKAQIIVQVTGTWAYQITPRIQKQLAALIAGKTKQQAIATLLQVPGIAGAQITLRGGNQTLPQNSKAIRILVQYTPDQVRMQ
jgi:hypothetical protein